MIVMKYHEHVNIDDVVPFNDEMPEGEKHMRAFMHAVVSDEQMPPETTMFLMKAFNRILRGHDPKEALSLITKQGKKGAEARAKRLTEKVRIAVMVEERIQAGMTIDDARQAVADSLELTYRTMRDTHNSKNKAMAKAFMDMIPKMQRLKEKRLKEKK